MHPRRLPTAFESNGAVDVGGLMSYGARGFQLHRRVASYMNKVFKGVTALGIRFPQSLLVQAKRAIE